MIDIRIQWHSPDSVFCAVFVRDGQEWFLNGALTGMESQPGDAVQQLIEEAQHLVIHGENALTDGLIPLEDRIWLFKLLDQGSEFKINEQMYAAIRSANGGKDPYRA